MISAARLRYRREELTRAGYHETPHGVWECPPYTIRKEAVNVLEWSELRDLPGRLRDIWEWQEPFEVGDRVVSKQLGEGIITDIKYGAGIFWCTRVMFDSGNTGAFSKAGWFNLMHDHGDRLWHAHTGVAEQYFTPEGWASSELKDEGVQLKRTRADQPAYKPAEDFITQLRTSRTLCAVCTEGLPTHPEFWAAAESLAQKLAHAMLAGQLLVYKRAKQALHYFEQPMWYCAVHT